MSHQMQDLLLSIQKQMDHYVLYRIGTILVAMLLEKLLLENQVERVLINADLLVMQLYVSDNLPMQATCIFESEVGRVKK